MRAVLATAALVVLAGCAQSPLKPPEGPLEFEVLGRIAARYGNDGFTGNVDWRHAKAGDDMLISTPLGQGVARIVREGDAVQLTTADGKQYNAPDAETLTERVLGFRVPLEGLAEWVQGRQREGIEDRGWRVQYLEWDGERPKLMQLNYPGI